MRPPVDAERIRALAQALGEVARQETTLYLTGGATAVIEGWRERSPFVLREGRVTVRHFDLYSQALSKIERGFGQDLEDVASMVREGLVDPRRARAFFDATEDLLHRYPAIEPAAFRAKVARALG